METRGSQETASCGIAPGRGGRGESQPSPRGASGGLTGPLLPLGDPVTRFLPLLVPRRVARVRSAVSQSAW